MMRPAYTGYSRQPQGRPPMRRAIYRTAAAPVFETIGASEERPSPHPWRGRSRGPGWPPVAAPTPTIQESTARLMGALLTRYQRANIQGEFAQVLDQLTSQVNRSAAVTFRELVHDLTRTVQGVISAAGRTFDPKRQPRQYELGQVGQLLWRDLRPLLKAVGVMSREDRERAAYKRDVEASDQTIDQVPPDLPEMDQRLQQQQEQLATLDKDVRALLKEMQAKPKR